VLYFKCYLGVGRVDDPFCGAHNCFGLSLEFR